MSLVLKICTQKDDFQSPKVNNGRFHQLLASKVFTKLKQSTAFRSVQGHIKTLDYVFVSFVSMYLEKAKEKRQHKPQ